MAKTEKNTKDNLSDDKVYEMAVLSLHHLENKIESINKFYLSIFSSLLLALPFVINYLSKNSTLIGLDKSSKDYLVIFFLRFCGMFTFLWLFQCILEWGRANTINKIILQIENQYSKNLFAHKNDKISFYIEVVFRFAFSIAIPIVTFLFAYFLYSGGIIFIQGEGI